jgi:cyanate permease
LRTPRLKDKFSALTVLAVIVASGLPQTAWADGQQSAPSLPKRLFAFTLGTAIGTPIAIARCTHREIVKRTKEAYELGGMPKPIGYATAAFFGVPSGIAFGAGVGAADGVVDSWTNSEAEPVNKGSISLDKLYF